MSALKVINPPYHKRVNNLIIPFLPRILVSLSQVEFDHRQVDKPMSEFSYIDQFQLWSAPFQVNFICKISTFKGMFMPMIYCKTLPCPLIFYIHIFSRYSIKICCDKTCCNGLSQNLLIRMANYGRHAGRFQNRISNII